MAELRTQIDESLAAGDWAGAAAALARLWQLQPTSATAGFVTSRFESLRGKIPLAASRLAILRSFTLEPALPLLKAAGLVNGIDLKVQVGEFNSYAQEILDESSKLYEFAPDVAVLAVELRAVAPELWDGYADLAPAQVSEAVARVAGQFEAWIGAFRARSGASLVVHTLEQPVMPSQGVLDGQGPQAQQLAVQQINLELRRVASAHPGVYLLDYDSLVARHGRLRWHDERKWLMARMPIAADNLIHLANEWLRLIYPLRGRTCKVLVTDLDNTLWGGILGEDGAEGIKIGSEYPGGAFQNLQRALLDLYRRGTLLAISSKNDETEALQVLETHSGMLLRPAHFSAFRVNWNDKPKSLREIAAELNVGIDALAFLDDNPAERDRVRLELPEVYVIELAQDPFAYAPAVRNCPVFERLAVLEEDRARAAYYAGQRERTHLARGMASVEDYYRSLQQEVEIARADETTFARVAQLSQKTNQFNMTTRRYTEQQIAQLAATPGWIVHTVRVKDRFGDNGVVGLAITYVNGEVCEIDTLALSCRVIGRTVETALLSYLTSAARQQGARRLQGWFLPTKKNEPAREFYARHTFQLICAEEGRGLWSLDISEAGIPCPEWIRLIVPKEPLYCEHACS